MSRKDLLENNELLRAVINQITTRLAQLDIDEDETDDSDVDAIAEENEEIVEALADVQGIIDGSIDWHVATAP